MVRMFVLVCPEENQFAGAGGWCGIGRFPAQPLSLPSRLPATANTMKDEENP